MAGPSSDSSLIKDDSSEYDLSNALAYGQALLKHPGSQLAGAMFKTLLDNSPHYAGNTCLEQLMKEASDIGEENKKKLRKVVADTPERLSEPFEKCGGDVLYFYDLSDVFFKSDLQSKFSNFSNLRQLRNGIYHGCKDINIDEKIKDCLKLCFRQLLDVSKNDNLIKEVRKSVVEEIGPVKPIEELVQNASLGLMPDGKSTALVKIFKHDPSCKLHGILQPNLSALMDKDKPTSKHPYRQRSLMLRKLSGDLFTTTDAISEISSSKTRLFGIVGESGMGKATFCHHLISELKSISGHHTLLIYMDLKNNSLSELKQHLRDEQLFVYYKDSNRVNDYADLDVMENCKKLDSALNKVFARFSPVFVIYGYDDRKCNIELVSHLLLGYKSSKVVIACNATYYSSIEDLAQKYKVPLVPYFLLGVHRDEAVEYANSIINSSKVSQSFTALFVDEKFIAPIHVVLAMTLVSLQVKLEHSCNTAELYSKLQTCLVDNCCKRVCSNFQDIHETYYIYQRALGLASNLESITVKSLTSFDDVPLDPKEILSQLVGICLSAEQNACKVNPEAGKEVSEICEETPEELTGDALLLFNLACELQKKLNVSKESFWETLIHEAHLSTNKNLALLKKFCKQIHKSAWTLNQKNFDHDIKLLQYFALYCGGIQQLYLDFQKHNFSDKKLSSLCEVPMENQVSISVSLDKTKLNPIDSALIPSWAKISSFKGFIDEIKCLQRSKETLETLNLKINKPSELSSLLSLITTCPKLCSASISASDVAGKISIPTDVVSPNLFVDLTIEQITAKGLQILLQGVREAAHKKKKAKTKHGTPSEDAAKTQKASEK